VTDYPYKHDLARKLDEARHGLATSREAQWQGYYAEIIGRRLQELLECGDVISYRKPGNKTYRSVIVDGIGSRHGNVLGLLVFDSKRDKWEAAELPPTVVADPGFGISRNGKSLIDPNAVPIVINTRPWEAARA
jgi:hypothetical protein